MAKRPFYVGHWELIPELSLYQAGTPPARGAYSIDRAEDGSLTLRVSWRASTDAEPQSVAFGGFPDGSPQPIAATHGAAAPDSFSLTHVDDFTLDSAAMAGSRVVAYARRVASADGTLLVAVQEMDSEAGSRVRNFQVYRRAMP